MQKKLLIFMLAALFIIMTAAPLEVAAAPPWWGRFKEIAKADILGACDGYLQTVTPGGAIAGGLKGSIEAANEEGVPGGDWAPVDGAAESIGLHHNLALSHVYDSAAGKAVFDDRDPSKKLTAEERQIMQRLIVEYLVANRLTDDRGTLERYLRGVDHSIEEILRRIREGSTGPYNPNPEAGGENGAFGHGAVFSENFFSNLQQALSILDKEADDPQLLLDEAIVFFLNASLRETDEELRDDIIDKAKDYNSTRSNRVKSEIALGDDEDSPLHIDKISATFQALNTDGQPADIVLAWIFVDVLQRSSQYWSEVYCWGGGETRAQTGENGDIEVTAVCWAADFSRLIMNPDADPEREDVFMILDDFADLDDDGDGIPEGVADDEEPAPAPAPVPAPVTETYFQLVLTIDEDTALSGEETKVLDAAPFIEDGRTLVPFRFIGEELGAEIGWDDAERRVSYLLDDNKVELWIGLNRARVNDQETTVDQNPDVTPLIRNGRTMVPIRFISEALGFDVEWNPNTRQVTVAR